MTRQRLAVALSFSVIVAATLTSGGRSNDARWSVACIMCSETWLADAISNVALFVPLAAALAWRSTSSFRSFVSPLRTLLLCTVLSLVIELLQFSGLPSGRTPSLLDWLSNSAGALLGVGVARWWPLFVQPSLARARVFALAWTVAALLALTLSSLALSPSTPVTGDSAAIAPSTVPYTPGYGWYAANARSVQVNDVAIPHNGNGPVMVEMERTNTMRATVEVFGRDGRNDVVPIVYAYRARDRAAMARDTIARLPKPRGYAHLLLAQRGNDAVLQSNLRAYQYGLALPMLALHDAFVALADGQLADSAQRWLTASVTARSWTLTARGPDSLHEKDDTLSAAHVPTSAHAALLTLTPAIGWALIQTLVRLDATIAPALTVIWLMMWFAPIGYWLAYSIPSERANTAESQRHHIGSAPHVAGGAIAGVFWAALLTAAVSGLAAWCDSPPLTNTDTAVCSVGLLLGVLAARVLYDRRKLRTSAK